MKKQYKVNSRNSTVCGYPGREFDWTLFDWDGEEIHNMALFRSEKDMPAPKPWIDDGLIAPNCEYLHVPYDWKKHGTIYRVRPNDCMWAGEVYRGRLIVKQKAIKLPDGWYWELDFGEMKQEGVE